MKFAISIVLMSILLGAEPALSQTGDGRLGSGERDTTVEPRPSAASSPGTSLGTPVERRGPRLGRGRARPAARTLSSRTHTPNRSEPVTDMAVAGDPPAGKGPNVCTPSCTDVVLCCCCHCAVDFGGGVLGASCCVACYVLDTATKGEDDDGYTATFAGAPACGLVPEPIRVDPVDPLVQLEAGRYYDADGRFIADPSNVSVSFAYMESGAFAEDSGADRVWLPAGQGSPSESGTWVATFDATDLASGSYLVQASFDFEDGSTETAISSLVVP